MESHRSKTKQVNSIPPPPGPEAEYDELIAYLSKYSLDELERAGYAEIPSAKEAEEVTAAAAYHLLCRNGLQLKLARKDYEQLSRLAVRKDVSVAALVKDWIKQRLSEEAKQLTGRQAR
jgi:hypothetical protein